MSRRSAVAWGLLVVLFCGAAGARAFNVRYEYYVYANYSDGIPVTEELTLTGQTHTDGAFTKVGSEGNWGYAEYSADIASTRVTAYAHAHGVQVSTYAFGTSTGRVEYASWADELTFTVPAGSYPEGLTVSLAGRVDGSVASDVGAGAQAAVRAMLGAGIWETDLLEVGIYDAGSQDVHEDFSVSHLIVVPGTVLPHATDYTVTATIFFRSGRAWAVALNTGAGYVTGDATVDFREGARFTALTVPPGVSFTSASGVFGVPVSAVPPGAVPAPTARLLGNAPNPFNPRTVVAYELDAASPVRLGLHDLAGRRVRTLVAGEARAAGVHQAPWDGRDDAGQPVAAGVYLCRLEACGTVVSRTLVLVK